MAIDYVVLKVEIETDPKGLGYAGKLDQQKADLLNASGLSNETLEVGDIGVGKLQAEVVGTEWLALTVSYQNLWLSLMNAQTVNMKSQLIRDQIDSVWGIGTTTRTNLVALRTRLATRGEILFGEGTKVEVWDVARARELN